MQREGSPATPTPLKNGLFEFNRKILDISRLNKAVPLQLRQHVLECIQNDILQISEMKVDNELCMALDGGNNMFRIRIDEFIAVVDLSDLSDITIEEM